MAASNQLVLLTGSNGHIGFRTLVFLLRAGYKVRACVRSQSKEDLIRNATSIKDLLSKGAHLEFAHIPDLLVDGAYDSAIEGVDLAVHIGGPIAHGNEPLDTVQEKLIDPSIKGTMNMLYACEKAPSVKRVVLCSSVVGIMDWNNWLVTDTGRVFNEQSRVSEEEKAKPPYSMSWQAYANAKVDSLNISEKWVREKTASGKLHFDVVNVHPSIVIGAHELQYTKAEVIEGTNFLAIMNVMGNTSSIPIAGATVHIDDCAEVFVRSLDKAKVSTHDDGLRSVIAHSCSPEGSKWDDSFPTIKKTWPQYVEEGKMPCTGSQPSKRIMIDASATEKLLGMKFKGYDEQIKSLFTQWVSHCEKEGWKIEQRVV